MHSKTSKIEEILFQGTNAEKVFLFSFTEDDDVDLIYKKFQIFSRFFFLRYYNNKPSKKHEKLVKNYINSYLGNYNFLVKGFRGCAKTSFMKLLMVFFLSCDKRKNTRRYMKILCRDLSNSRQVTTDVYNMLLEVMPIFGDMFEKEGDKKREETMGGFTIKGDRKFTAGTVGQDQRGKIQDAYRPDFLWFDDIEDRTSVSSQVITQSVIEKVEEALDGMSPDGTYVCTANYISEYGSVAYLAGKENVKQMLFPIMEDNTPTWEDRFPFEKCMEIKKNAYDWFGEYLCLKPDTKILTSNGWIEISNIKVGDKVITHKNVEQKVLQVFKSESDDLLDITVDDKVVTITKNHPVLVLRNGFDEWVEAGKLTIEDLVILIPRGKLLA